MNKQYLQRLAEIESNNNPKAQNPNSSAKGRFQFVDDTAQQYGLDRYDFGTKDYERAELRAVQQFTRDNKKQLQKGLGREPTDGELYLAHQQGAQGALNLLSNPNARASDVVGSEEIRLNGGNENMTAQQFASQWTSKFEGGEGQDTMAGGQGQDNLGRVIRLPDGRKLRLTGSETPEQLTQLKDKLRSKYQQPVEAAEPSPKNQPRESFGRTVLEQGLQGATFGFADEITDRIGAGIASVATGQDFGELLQEARGLTEERFKRQFEQRPITSIASNLGGALVTGAAGAATKAGAGIGNLVRSGNIASRIGKGAAVGAASGAAFGSGTAKDGERADGAKSGAILGAATGGVIPIIGAAGSGINRVLGKKSPIPNADQLRKQASALYKQADEIGGVLKSEVTDSFLDSVQGLRPQTKAGKLLQGDTPFTKIAQNLESLRGKKLSLAEAQEVDEFLGDAIDGLTEMGRLTKQGKKILDIQTAFRNQIEDAAEGMVEGGKAGFNALKEGRKLWSTSRKLADVERIIQRAELTDNPASSIKSGFRTLLNNPKRLKGYTKAEKKAIKKAAETGLATGALRILGSRLNSIIAIGSGAGGLGGTAAISAGSAASRGAASAIQIGKAKNVANIVANQGRLQKQGLITLNRPKSLTTTNPLIAATQGRGN